MRCLGFSAITDRVCSVLVCCRCGSLAAPLSFAQVVFHVWLLVCACLMACCQSLPIYSRRFFFLLFVFLFISLTLGFPCPGRVLKTLWCLRLVVHGTGSELVFCRRYPLGLPCVGLCRFAETTVMTNSHTCLANWLRYVRICGLKHAFII